MKKLVTVFTIGFILFSLSGCASAQPFDANAAQIWKPGELRILLDPEIENSHPQVIAVYSRYFRDALQIRLDFLNAPNLQNLSIDLAIDSLPGGMQSLPGGPTTTLVWDLLASVEGDNQQLTLAKNLSQPLAECGFSFDLQPVDESAVFTIHCPALLSSSHAITQFELLLQSNDVERVTRIGPARLDQPSPSRAPFLLAFWDSFHPQTPARALRSWNGAHTGPYGRRHGLLHLIQSAETYNVPVAILDLKRPLSLAALDYFGEMKHISQLEDSGILILPLSAQGDPETSSRSLHFSQESSRLFRLSASRMGFGPLTNESLSRLDAIFATLPDSHHLIADQDIRFIPLPDPQESFNQPPSAENQSHPITNALKKALIQTALSSDPVDILVVGGDLSSSAWGDSSFAPAAMQYIAAHPWIQPLRESDLMSFAAIAATDETRPRCTDALCTPGADTRQALYAAINEPAPSGVTENDLRSLIKSKLLTLPDTEVSQAAWQAYFELTGGTIDVDHQKLQSIALLNTMHLVEAAAWARHPSAIQDCSRDIDSDGLFECVLADERWFTSFELEGGRMILAVFRNGQHFNTLIIPTDQIAPGLSDPKEMDFTYGPLADQASTPGVLFFPENPKGRVEARITQNRLELVDPVSNHIIEISLSPDSLRISGRSPQPGSITIPFSFAFGNRLTAGWSENSGDSAPFPWQPDVPIHWKWASKGLEQPSLVSFYDSHSLIVRPEDPDLGYPTGHYLPTTMTLFKATTGAQYELLLSAEINP